jgi:chromosome segregation ATPase
MSDSNKENSSNDEKRKLIFLECETMENENAPDISSRTVAARPGIAWGKSTVSKYVTEWHHIKDGKLLEVLEQTRMSHHFVTALNTEIETRMTDKSEMFKKTIERIGTELKNVTEDLEATELKTTQLEIETSELRVNSAELKTEYKNLNTKYNETVQALSAKYNEMVQTLNAKFTEETERLNKVILEANGKIEGLHTSLNDKTEELGKQRNIAEYNQTENNNLAKEVNEQNKTLRKQNEEITKNKQEISGLEQKVIGQENELKSKDEIIKIHLNQAKEISQSLKDSQTKVELMDNNATATAGDLANANTRASTLEVQLDNSEKNVTRLEQEIKKNKTKS